MLLLLKAQAAKERWHAEKRMKDRIDIISLLDFADVKHDLLKQLVENTTKSEHCLMLSDGLYQKAELSTSFLVSHTRKTGSN